MSGGKSDPAALSSSDTWGRTSQFDFDGLQESSLHPNSGARYDFEIARDQVQPLICEVAGEGGGGRLCQHLRDKRFERRRDSLGIPNRVCLPMSGGGVGAS